MPNLVRAAAEHVSFEHRSGCDWSHRLDFFEVGKKLNKRLAVDFELFQGGVAIGINLVFLGVVFIAEGDMIGC